MKQLIIPSLIAVFVMAGCSSGQRQVTEGRIVYAIDYPDHKDNFFLYSILPKEMELNFNGDRMESRIQKANLMNVLLVDCNKKDVGAYFEYGDDAFHVNLKPADVKKMVADQKKYKIRYTNEESVMAGFRVKKALATAAENSSDVVTLWYTEEIQMKNPNWYNPFSEIPGFLLAYSIDRFGIRMVFEAKSFEETTVPESMLRVSEKGSNISYTEYSKRLTELFQTFE